MTTAIYILAYIFSSVIFVGLVVRYRLWGLNIADTKDKGIIYFITIFWPAFAFLVTLYIFGLGMLRVIRLIAGPTEQNQVL